MGVELPEYIELLPTRDKGKTLYTLRYKGRLVHSLYDPEKEARDEVGRAGEINRYKLVIILGLGLGYILQPLLEKTKAGNVRIIAIEQEGHFRKLQSLSSLPRNVLSLFGRPAEEVMDRLSGALETVRLNEILFLENKVLSEIHRVYYDTLKERILTRLRQQLADLTTTSYFSDQWITNSFINLKRIKNIALINSLKEAFPGQTALLASSGPSLERYTDYIRNYQGVIFALPPSLPFLLKNRIRPDFVILADSGFSSILHLRDAFSSGLKLICDLSAHPALLSHWQGLKVIMNFAIPGFEIFYRTYQVPFMPQGGTVASTVLYLVKYMGFRNLLLLGQDFAYHDVKTHVAGSGYEAYLRGRISRFSPLPHLAFDRLRHDWLERRDGDFLVDRKLRMYGEYFERTRKKLGVDLVSVQDAAAGSKKGLELKGQERIPPLPGLDDLVKKLKALRLQGPLQEFLKTLREDADLYSLLESLNFLLFYRITQGMDPDPAVFYRSVESSIRKICSLLEDRRQP